MHHLVFLHVYMQRIGQSTREGGPASIDLEHFMEALHDPSTNLTYQALTGARKQSVSDVERLFSDKMVSFMEQKGYTAEGKYIRVVTDWRKACDERGLSDHEREKFNKTFLDYILDDLMPWHREADLSQLEVNRYEVLSILETLCLFSPKGVDLGSFGIGKFGQSC